MNITNRTVKIDADKLQELLVTEEWTDKSGNTHKKDVIVFELKSNKPEKQKVTYSDPNGRYDIVASDYAIKPQTKEDRQNKKDMEFVGSATGFVWKGDNNYGGQNQGQAVAQQVADEEDDDLPF